MFRPLTSRTILLLCSLLSLCFAWSVPTSCQATAHMEGDYGQLPLFFMENRGQINPEVHYYTQGSGFALGFTPKARYFCSIREPANPRLPEKTRRQGTPREAPWRPDPAG